MDIQDGAVYRLKLFNPKFRASPLACGVQRNQTIYPALQGI